jgi:hypothetical protein
MLSEMFPSYKLVGFGRACAPLCCAHAPVFLANGALHAPLAHRSFAAFYLPPKTFPNSGRQGRISFHWPKLHPTALHCILLSYAAPS